MRNKLWFLITALLIGALVLGACGRGGNDEPAEEPAAEAPAEAPAEEVAPTEVPTEVPTEAAPAEEAPAEEAAASEAMTETEEAAATEATTETEEVAATDATTETAAADASTTVTPVTGAANTLVIWADDTRAPLLNELAESFEAETGVKLAIVEKGFGNIRDDFKVAGPAGQGPDIFIGAHDWLGELAASGLVAEVSLGSKAEDFVPVAVDAFSYDGKLYGMPYAVENVAFVYNTDMVEEVPATWDDVKTLSQELIEGGAKYGIALPENDPFHFYGVQTAYGGSVFGTNEDGSWNPEDVGIDSEGTIAAFDWLDQMYKDKVLTAGAALNNDLILSAFSNGDAGMAVMGPWFLPNLRDSGVPFAVAPLPAGPDGPGRPFVGVQGFLVSAFSKQPLLAQTFLQEYIATDDTMGAIYEAGLRPSAFTSVNEAIEDAEVKAFAEAGVVGQPMPNIPQMSAVWSSWGNAMQLISQQAGGTPEEIMTEAAEQIRTSIAAE
ncbi:MAG: sugar ABC transporter substrate-binding protein [Caldilineaceae bacterium]